MKKINPHAEGFHLAYCCGDKINFYRINGVEMGDMILFFNKSQRPVIKRFIAAGYAISVFTATPGALTANPDSPKYNLIMSRANKPPIELRGNSLTKLIKELRSKECESIEKKPRRRYC